MACGLPAIAVDAYGPAEIVEHGETGWLVRARRRRRARQRARRGGQPPRRAPPPRRAAPREDGARALRLAGARRASRRGLRRGRAGYAASSRATRCVEAADRCVTQLDRGPGAGLTRCYLSAPSEPRMGRRVPAPVARLCTATCRRGRSASTTRPTSTTPAASRSSRGSTASRRTRRSQRAIVALENLEHRGAAGADPNTGDGAGILLQLPDEFLRGVVGAELPPPGALRRRRLLPAPGRGAPRRARGAARATPSRPRASASSAGATCRSTRTTSASPPTASRPTSSSSSWPPSAELPADQDAFERKLYVIRRVAELAAGPGPRDPVASRSRTIVYKGMLTAPQLLGYYPDLQDARDQDARSRSSTRASPRTRSRAGSSRTRTAMIAHNGEINTLRGNVNWMRARESQLASELFGDDLREGAAGRAPRRLGLGDVRQRARAARAGRPLAAARGDDDDPGGLRGPRRPARATCKGFYAFHSCLMEPWDGPAAVAFTDGRVIGATLDRNGLRPGRWLETKDGWVVLGSETGVMDEPAEQRRAQGPPAAGQALPRRPRARAGSSTTARSSARSPPRQPVRRLVRRGHRPPRRPARRAPPRAAPTEPLRARQLAFGYTQEDLRVLLAPTAAQGARSRSARWATTSRWPCSPTASRRCSPTSSSSSRRSPTRRSTRSARRS